jgi:hypothetical protein
MKKVAVLAVALVLVMAGASVAVAQTEDGADTPLGRAGTFIGEVLDSLVSDGTLTQDQADAVSDAVQTAHEERWAAAEERRAAVEEAWSDDVLTEEEAATLSDDGHMGQLLDPDGPLAEYWEDGRLTRDELDEAREAGVLGFGPGGHRGHGQFGGRTYFSSGDTETTGADA